MGIASVITSRYNLPATSLILHYFITLFYSVLWALCVEVFFKWIIATGFHIVHFDRVLFSVEFSICCKDVSLMRGEDYVYLCVWWHMIIDFCAGLYWISKLVIVYFPLVYASPLTCFNYLWSYLTHCIVTFTPFHQILIFKKRKTTHFFPSMIPGKL